MLEASQLGGELTPVACHACDPPPELSAGGKAGCSRCGCTLATRPADPVERPLAFAIAALLVLVVANTAPLWVGDMLRWAERTQPWAMAEVMMLGIMVALIKIADLAKVEAGIGRFAVGALMLLCPAILSSVDAEEPWARLAWQVPDPETSPAPEREPASKQAHAVVGNAEPGTLATPSEGAVP
mgnify:CR=1 FL=1